MRSYLPFIFLFFTGKLFSQEPAIEINDKAMGNSAFNTPVKSQSSASYSAPRLTYSGAPSIYYNAWDHHLREQLAGSNINEVDRLVEKAKKNRKYEFIGFAAIPLGIVSALCVNRNQPELQSLKPIGSACLIASLSCLVLSPVATHRKNINYKKAVKIYNLKF